MSRLDKIVEKLQIQKNTTYSGSDVARAMDGLRANLKATVKGLHFLLERTPSRGKYDRWDFFVGLKKKWSTENSDIPISAGGTIEMLIVAAFEEHGFRRELR